MVYGRLAAMWVIWGAMGNRGRGRQGCGVWPVACGHWHLARAVALVGIIY